MNEQDKKTYIARYAERYKKFGYSPLSLGWGKGGRQKIRFQVLTEIGVQQHSSILDVGCGFGDFYGYLKKRGWDGTYLGVDIVDDLLTEAKQQYPGIEVQNADILKQESICSFDYVVCSGVFNAKLHYEENDEYITNMLKRMYELSLSGVAVDFMSSYVDFQHEIAFHAKPEKILAIAKNFSKRVTLRHDYMPYEFAVYLYRNDTIIQGRSVFKEFLKSYHEEV